VLQKTPLKNEETAQLSTSTDTAQIGFREIDNKPCLYVLVKDTGEPVIMQQFLHDVFTVVVGGKFQKWGVTYGILPCRKSTWIDLCQEFDINPQLPFFFDSKEPAYKYTTPELTAEGYIEALPINYLCEFAFLEYIAKHTSEKRLATYFEYIYASILGTQDSHYLELLKAAKDKIN
jgi:hypothetical protein